MALPSLELGENLDEACEYIHFFVTSRRTMDRVFPELKAYLSAQGVLWVSWPKGGKLGTDLTLPQVIELGYSHGLIESTVVSVDDTWSAIKFTHPKPGKTYHNRYGTLPERPSE